MRRNPKQLLKFLKKVKISDIVFFLVVLWNFDVAITAFTQYDSFKN